MKEADKEVPKVYTTGDTIKHVTFGEGTVLTVSDQAITVLFGKKEKTLLLKYNTKTLL